MWRCVPFLCLAWSANVSADAGLNCPLDDGLSRAAAELLLDAERPNPEALNRAIREADSDAVRVRALWLPQDDPPRVAGWLDAFREAADAPTVCGEASGSAGRLIVATARGGSLSPVVDSASAITGELHQGFVDPQLVVSEGDGSLSRLAVTRKLLRDGIPIAKDLVRPATIQLVATGASGPRPVAERTIPEHGATAGEDLGPARQSDAPAFVQLEDVRRDAGALAVRDNQLLARVAKKHAKLVCATGHVAHELESGENPKKRLRSEGISARQVGETVARAAHESAAFASLLRSPSHRLTLQKSGFTDAGVGTAKDARGRTCLVVLLASWPRYVGR